MTDVSEAMTLSKRKQVILLALVVVSVVAGSFLAWKQSRDAAGSYTELARKIVAACANSDYHPSCYDEEIPKLMDRGFSMEDAFEVTRAVQQMDNSYQYCHVLGHYLSAKETAKDPSKWKDVVARAPLGVCSNGAVHGAFQERFRVESLEGSSIEEIEPELRGVCEPREGWQPTLMGQATCTHAMGHLTMYVTGADIDASLELCDRLLPSNPKDTVRQLCYDGAFMQIYQPLEPEDIALIQGKEVATREASVQFCNRFTGAPRGSCISESWPLYRNELDDPGTLPIICDRASFDDWQHERCMNGVFYVAMAQSNLSVEWAAGFCSEMTEEYRGMCFGNSASRLIETDSRNVERALLLCQQATDSGASEPCFDELLKYSGYTFAIGSPEFYALCNGLPEPWQGKCLAQVGRAKL